MKKVFVVVSGLLMAALIVQFYFAAVGAFTKPQTDSSYMLHSINGMMVVPLLILLSTLFAALAKAPGKLVGRAILPLGLLIVQVLLVALVKAFADAAGDTTAVGVAIGGLHALNGALMIGVAESVFRGARKLAAGTPVDVEAS